MASIKRWGAKDALGRLMMASLAKMAPVDKKTFTIELETPFGLVLDALGKPSASPCVHHAGPPGRHRPQRAGQGSRSARGRSSSSRTSGSRATASSTSATPTTCRARRRRAAPPAASARCVDRVEWRYIPDAATAGAALEAGEVDYWENVPARLRAAAGEEPERHRVRDRSQGSQGILRPNHLHPPFNNKKARQALLLHGGPEERTCRPSSATRSTTGRARASSCAAACPTRPRRARRQAEPRARPAAPEGVAATTAGRSSCSIRPTRRTRTRPRSSRVEMLQSIGANVDLQAMDWSTMVARRAKKEPPRPGRLEHLPHLVDRRSTR